MAVKSMTKEAAARRYLESSRAASMFHDGEEGATIHRETMAELRKHHPNVAEHALLGAGQDFDEPPGRTELEHQRQLRSDAGLTNSDIVERRKALRGRGYGAPSPAKPKAAPRKTRATPRRRVKGAGAVASAPGDAVAGRGNIFMQLLGWTLVLSVIYLLLTGKGVSALTGLVNVVVGGVTTFIRPVDPIASLEGALGASPIHSGAEGGGGGESAPGSAGAPAAGGTDAPAPGSLTTAGPARPTSSLGVPVSRLKAVLRLRAEDRPLVAKGLLSNEQFTRAEEHLVPRAKYPKFYGAK